MRIRHRYRGHANWGVRGSGVHSSSRRSPKGMHESDLRNSSIGQKTAAKLTTLHVRIKEGIDGEEFNAFIDDLIRVNQRLQG